MFHLFGHTLDFLITPYAPWQAWTLFFSGIGLGIGFTGLLFFTELGQTWQHRDKNSTS